MKISVVLPVYDGGELLRKSIKSVLNQSSNDFEFLICDDCSSDDSLSLLKSITDSRVKLYINKKNIGLFPTLNFLIREASGELIHLWSQDDVMYPECLEETIKFHEKYPSIGFSYSDLDIINEKDQVLQKVFTDLTPEYIDSSLHDKIALYIGSIAGNIANVTINKNALNKVGLFDESYKISGDFEMWVRLTSEFPVGRIPLKLIKLRNHSGQLSRKISSEIIAIEEDLRIYDQLLNRVDETTKRWGVANLKKQKNIYYFSIFLKAIKFKKFNEAWKIAKLINRTDFFLKVPFRWIVAKFLATTNTNEFLFAKRLF